ncbi:hypothetical protein BDV96DRAFT_650980 [Lophiotrema nucula]|uniref:BTB domain-containing protein n=1 Tax=Lophiotrema nucula TaxID=690887 RepID=A0A6A5YT59_9PLEO|nr:hypothetical protein BDV96DRAFT_650980 [Lophiotrema nucula]
MEPSLADKLQSPLVTFRLGAAGMPVIIHSGVIADLSDLLRALIDRSVNDGTQKVIRIPEVAQDDFLRLCEFAYSAEYTVPTYEIDEDDNEEEGVNDEGGDSKNTDNGSEEKMDSSNSGPRIPSIMPTLVAHARMYRLAAKYLIEPLGEEALASIHHTCVDLFEHGTEKPGDVVELIRIAYEDPTAPEGTAGGGRNMTRLQWYVVLIAATLSNAKALDESLEFRRILEKGGEFVVSFWQCSRSLDEVRKAAGL